MESKRIAVIAGDGIGKEVMPEGLRCLEAAARRYDIRFQWDEFGWDCDCYLKYGTMMPEDWMQQIGRHDAIFFGAVGWPETGRHRFLHRARKHRRRIFQRRRAHV